MNSVFSLQFNNCCVDRGLQAFFARSIMKDVELFNAPLLPQPLRIPVQILHVRDFEAHKRTASLPEIRKVDSYAYSDSQIYVLAYPHLEGKIYRVDYLKMIRHECIHILQHLVSRVPPNDMIWLYESVACAIAKQHTKKLFEPPDWFTFSNDFYSIPHCYEVAYIFGKALLEAFPLSDLIALSRRKRECCRESEKIYKWVFSK